MREYAHGRQYSDHPGPHGALPRTRRLGQAKRGAAQNVRNHGKKAPSRAPGAALACHCGHTRHGAGRGCYRRKRRHCTGSRTKRTSTYKSRACACKKSCASVQNIPFRIVIEFRRDPRFVCASACVIASLCSSSVTALLLLFIPRPVQAVYCVSIGTAIPVRTHSAVCTPFSSHRE